MRVSLFAILAILFQSAPPPVLPAPAVAQLARNVEAASAHRQHVWRDTPPFAADGRVNAFVEIGRGDRRKFELDMATLQLRVDRMIEPSIGGYAVNYGFVPQTVSYDGDPFDVLVLGPALKEGTVLSGAIVGLFGMEDEKGLDSKVVISPVDAAGRVRYPLRQADRARIAGFFRVYKRGETARFSKVTGWGTVDEGRAFVRYTHAFFTECRGVAGACTAKALR